MGVIRKSRAFDRIVPKTARVEVLSEVFASGECPVLMAEHCVLVFS